MSIKKYADSTGLTEFWSKVKSHVATAISGKQDTLVSGTNIKTVNNTSLLGNGDISISGGSTVSVNRKTTTGTNIADLTIDGNTTQLYAPVMDSVYCRKYESRYVVSSVPASTIPIGVTGITEADILFVDINGLSLNTSEYSISGTNIILNTPITTAGQIVHFIVLRMVSASIIDYSALKGDPGEPGEPGTTVYSELTDKPSIENVVLTGNKTAEQLGLAKASSIPTKVSSLTNDSGYLTLEDLPIYNGGVS